MVLDDDFEIAQPIIKKIIQRHRTKSLQRLFVSLPALLLYSYHVPSRDQTLPYGILRIVATIGDIAKILKEARDSSSYSQFISTGPSRHQADKNKSAPPFPSVLPFSAPSSAPKPARDKAQIESLAMHDGEMFRSQSNRRSCHAVQPSTGSSFSRPFALPRRRSACSS